jgi:hypothetical protein
MSDLIPALIVLALGAIIGSVVSGYADLPNTSDCKEYAKKQHKAHWWDDHETLLQESRYREHYKYCLREL